MTTDDENTVREDEIRFPRHTLRDVRPPRPLTAWEHGAIERMLSVPFEGQDAALQQLDVARVEAECTHCPLVLLSERPPGSLPLIMSAGAPMRGAVPGTLIGEDVDGMYVQFLVFVRDGQLSILEAFRGDNEAFQRVPDLDELRLESRSHNLS